MNVLVSCFTVQFVTLQTVRAYPDQYCCTCHSYNHLFTSQYLATYSQYIISYTVLQTFYTQLTCLPVHHPGGPTYLSCSQQPACLTIIPQPPLNITTSDYQQLSINSIILLLYHLFNLTRNYFSNMCMHSFSIYQLDISIG